MSPYDSPAPYSLLQYTEIAEGIFYPRGGFHKVIESLENIATKKFGAKFTYNTNIEKIIIDDNKVAKGVRFEDGHEEYADLVICNADLVYAYNNLLPETSYGNRLGKDGTLTSSSVSFYWGMKRKMPEFGVHNIFLAKDYKPSFDDIFKKHLYPEDPSFYVNVPSRIDPSAAPEGKETIVCLLPIGHLAPNNEHCIEQLVKQSRDRIIKIMEQRLNIENFESLIDNELINDPRTWQSKFNLWKGSILGLSHYIPQVLHFRPSIRSHIFKNLYFVGASAHPGTGVPIVLCGAKLAEKIILEDMGIVERKSEDARIILEYTVLIALIFLFVTMYLMW